MEGSLINENSISLKKGSRPYERKIKITKTNQKRNSKTIETTDNKDRKEERIKVQTKTRYDLYDSQSKDEKESEVYSNDNNFYTIKGILEALFDKLGISKRIIYSSFNEADKQCYQFMHPAQSATVSILGKNKDIIGYIGRLHPVLEDKLKFNQKLFIFEINIEAVIEAINNNIVKYKKLPIFPAIQRDIAFIAPKEITNEEINKTIKKVADKSIFKSSKLFDIYEGNNIEEGKKSFAYRITLQDETKTLTDEIIQAEINKIKSGLEKNIIGLSMR